MCILMQGGEVKDPIRRGLGNAIQWYDCLRTTVNDFEDDLISKGAKLARSMISLAGPSRGMPITATANREQDSWDAVPVHPEDAQSVQLVCNAIIESQTYPDDTENMPITATANREQDTWNAAPHCMHACSFGRDFSNLKF